MKTTDELEVPTFSRSINRNIGYVYCLSNPAMPGLVKIGFTLRTAKERSRELFTGYQGNSATGVPLPFEVVRYWQVPAEKAEEIEWEIHSMLDDYRVPAHEGLRPKEFFYLSPDQAVVEVEAALKQLDWWGVAQAEINQVKQETAAREERRRAELLTQAQKSALRDKAITNLQAARIKETQDRAQKEVRIQAEIANKKRLLMESVKNELEPKDRARGFKWAAIWFLGSAFFFIGLLSGKDSSLWLSGVIGVVAYFWNKGGSVNDYLQSSEGLQRFSEIEAEVRRRMQ